MHPTDSLQYLYKPVQSAFGSICKDGDKREPKEGKQDGSDAELKGLRLFHQTCAPRLVNWDKGLLEEE